MHAAVRRGDPEVVRLLLQSGADKAARNALGLDAAALAEVAGPFPVLVSMLKYA